MPSIQRLKIKARVLHDSVQISIPTAPPILGVAFRVGVQILRDKVPAFASPVLEQQNFAIRLAHPLHFSQDSDGIIVTA